MIRIVGVGKLILSISGRQMDRERGIVQSAQARCSSPTASALSATADEIQVTEIVDPDAFTVLSLCSGIGGLDLGLRLAVPAARTICYVEMGHALAREIRGKE